MADPWDQANYKPDLTDKQLPSIQVRTNRLTVESTSDKAALAAAPVFVRNLRIKAERGNKGLIYIGSNVSINLTVNGYPLQAGEELTLDVNDLSLVYYQGDTINDALRIIYGS